MPSLRKRKLKSGGTYWDIRYRVAGKERYFPIGVTDRRTAEKILVDFRSGYAESRSAGTEYHPCAESEKCAGPTLSDLARHAGTFAEANKSFKTSDREQTAFRNMLTVLGDIELRELNGSAIEQYKAVRLRKVSPHTVNIELRVLNAAMNQAVELGLIDQKVLPKTKQIRTPAPDPPQWLSAEQIARLLSHKDEEFRRFMQFALYTGCRRNEILGLGWSDIDLPRRQIVVRGEIGKMGKRRTIPINDALHEIFVKWPRERTGLLFPDYKSDSVSQKFRRLARILSLPEGISLHSLRSTFASQLIEKGVDIYTVSRLLGHSSVKVTEKHYVGLDQAHVLAAVNMLGKDA